MIITHIPNRIPATERITLTVFSILLFVYGSYGVWVNDFYVPGRRSRGVHLHDIPAWMMYGAVICACLVMLSIVVDHYDRRPNERHYRTFAHVFKFLGWAFFGMSLFAWLFGRA
jgi:TRAP-type C4-dicarboxylate transport system permease small subunit